MISSNTWQTSVNDLVNNFLMAINSIVPAMLAARILDKNLIGYDDWARICDNLFNILVVEPIRESLPENERLDFDLPMYNTEYETLEHFSLIQVHQNEAIPGRILTEETVILNSYESSGKIENELDEIETFKIDSDFKIIEESFQTYKTDMVSYTCLLSKNGKWDLLDKISSKLD
jgi:hypothetical protein